MKRLLTAMAVVAAALWSAAPAAHADLVFTLDQQACSGTCAPGPFGTVTLTQINTTTVGVNFTLENGAKFVDTGAGDAFAFNIAGDPHIQINNLNSGYAIDGTLPVHMSAFGFFDYGILCSSCGPGGSSPQPGPITFSTTDGSALSVNNFISNGTAFFAADIIAGNGKTGNVGSDGPGVTVNAPEPASLGLLSVGVLGLGLLRRRQTTRS